MDVVEKTVTGMAKYIDREALVEWLKRIPLKDLSDGRGLCRVIFEEDFKRAIKKIPKGIIADVAPVRHGRWVEPLRLYYGAKQYECSLCYSDTFWRKHSITVKYPYCPNCGCRMDGGDDE